MPSTLIVGASRGLGASLVKIYASSDPSSQVYGTTRSSSTPDEPSAKNITFLPSIDVSKPSVGQDLTSALKGKKVETLYIVAGYLALESFDEPNWDNEVKMYTTSSIGPVFVIQALVKSGVLVEGAKIILLSSESGSITLRHEKEGGGNYAHHASKTALNMVGKLLSLDLKDKKIAVGMVHPGFMRTEMTKGAGFDKFWDEAGAITPDEAAEGLRKWTSEFFDIEKTGTFWAPRGPGGIGTVEDVMGKASELPTPLQLPW